MQYFTAPLLLALLASTSALAQESVVKSAADAFGERVGIEQLGLYGEGQVRGFDLNATGAYRIEDAYFARAVPLNDPVVGGVSVRVGVNASRLAYPAPSGVVNYRLRSPTPDNRLNVGAGLRDYGSPVGQIDGSWTSLDKQLWLTGALIARPNHTWSGGTNGDALDVGLVGGWRPSENHAIRAFATTYMRDYDGDWGTLPKGGALPPASRRLTNYSPRWARVDQRNFNLGAIYRGEFGDWTLDASAFRSILDNRRSDYTLLETQPNGDAIATLFQSPEKTNTSDSGEIRLSRVFTAGAFSHLVNASVRARHSEVDLASSVAIPTGAFNLADEVPQGPEPAPWTGTRGLDTVDQLTGSLGYGLVWDERLQLRLGAHRSRYEKQVDTLTGVTTRGKETRWFYNASAVWSLTPSTSLFASYVTGLEESGVAPQNATNRNEVLPPVEATQKEFGVRHAFTDRLTLVAAVFEVSKPTTGFRADSTFGLVGEVTHSGVEASLSGRIGEKTDIVLGAVSYTPEVTGPLVDAGVVGSRSSGLAELIANASIERQLTPVWSVDAQVNYSGASFVDSRNSFKAPAITTLGLGARARFSIDGRPTTLRVFATNITDERGWTATTSGLLWFIAPRTVRAMLTMTFS